MGIYIWLLWHQMVIFCTEAGCMQVSMAHFNYLVGLGTLELVLEITGIIRIFFKKNPPKDKGPMQITRHGTRKIK